MILAFNALRNAGFAFGVRWSVFQAFGVQLQKP